MATKYVIGGAAVFVSYLYWISCKNEALKKRKEWEAQKAAEEKDRQKKLKWKSFNNKDKLIMGYCRSILNADIPESVMKLLQSYYKMILEIPWIAEEHKDEKYCCSWGDVNKRKSTMFGFVHFLGLDESDSFQTWTNPYLLKKVNLKINPSKMGTWFDYQCVIQDFINVFYKDGREGMCSTVTSNVDNPPWIIIDFKDRYIKPTYYMLKQDSCGNGNMQYWVLQVGLFL